MNPLTRCRRAVLTVALLASIAAVACQPVTAGPPVFPTPDQAVAPLVVSDSRTWAAYMGAHVPADYRYATYMGWRMADVADRIRAERDAGTLPVLVVDLGTNDSNPTWNGGWTRDDELVWMDVLGNLHPDTRVTIVLPWLTADASPEHRTQIDRARAFLIPLAASIGATVTDWRDYAERPGVTGTDGIHLLTYDPANALDITVEAAAATIEKLTVAAQAAA
jgi:hypothetical protein